jgi:uncharacterized protein YndB with AHSA1/START domain
MTTMTDQTAAAPVTKTISVNASPERAFHVFTAGYDTWWPRSHHIGKSPMKKAIIEGKAGGRCYTEQQDGTECDWGRVLVWEPPHRLVIAWQITHEWGYQPDLAQSSEVEVRFTPERRGHTRRSRAQAPGPPRRRRGGDADGRRFAERVGGLLQLYAARASEGA